MTSPGDITQLLRAGGSAHEELWLIVYDEMRTLARAVLIGRRRPSGPQTQTLVHEAYLRLLGSRGLDWNDRRHFFAVAARAMRFVLVDDARKRLAAKRGEGQTNVTFDDEALGAATLIGQNRCAEVLAVHQALDRLAAVNERHVRLVELRYFSGFTLDEASEALGVSRPTVVRDWRAVKIWLHGALADQAADAGYGR